MRKRRFSAIERDALFEAADGKCQICGIELDDNWEADHIEPYSKGGKTHIVNGQALCQKCNRKKGNKIVSQIELRPFQQEFLDKAIAKSKQQNEQKLSLVVHASAGSGKTLGSQVAADALIESGFVEQVVILVPRLNLAQQYELDWKEMRFQLPWQPTMKSLLHRSNDSPRLLAKDSSGYVTTYQSLCANPQKHIRTIAKKSTLLILDEAHQLGLDEFNQDSSRSAYWVQKVGELDSVKMIFVMSGTPYRTDGKRLLFAEYGDADEDNNHPLLADLEAKYRDGVREQYLRRFEAQLAQGGYQWTDIADGYTSTREISNGDGSVYQALQLPNFWQPLVDTFVENLYKQKTINSQFSGLIACMSQNQAQEVHKYLIQNYPQVKTLIAISKDGQKAQKALRDFKEGKHDVLITVSMAYVGYDHKPINTLLLLTHIRSTGYLMQLVARGLRVINDIEYNQQHCFVIAPDDPKMTKFVEFMRSESDAGYTERQKREQTERENTGKSQMLGFADQGFISDLRAMGIDPTGDASPEDMRYAEEIKQMYNIIQPVTEMLTIFRAMSGHSHFSNNDDDTQVQTQPSRPRLTHAEELANAKKVLSKHVGQLARQLCDVTVSPQEIGKYKQEIYSQLWRIYGKSMKEVDSIAEIRDRSKTIARWMRIDGIDDVR